MNSLRPLIWREWDDINPEFFIKKLRFMDLATVDTMYSDIWTRGHII